MEPLNKKETIEAVSKGIALFLAEQKLEFQNGIGKLVLKYALIMLIIALFHFTFHGRYQKIMEYLVSVGQ